MKKRIFKRVGACVLAGFLLLTPALQTYAEENVEKSDGDLEISVSLYNSENGSVEIEWESVDGKVYKAYKSMDGGNTYQSVGIDFSMAGNINVLQIYPCEQAVGQLKDWMEVNGYGKGIIKVDSVNIDDYNANPYQYLKSGNEWKYDVIFFGTSDRNSEKDLTEYSMKATEEYILTGHGCIMGHDTIANFKKDVGTDYFGKLKKYFNVEYVNSDQIFDSKVKIVRKGLFTSYPWEIGDVETVLIVPPTHNVGQCAYGDIWLQFLNVDYGLSNFYLTTYNNCAMIMTGHSNGLATDDEQKILANLIFYCNQLISESYVRDSSAMDYEAPSGVSLKLEKEDETEESYLVNATDFGTDYWFYVDEYDKRNTSTGYELRRSNVQSVNVATGIDYYAYCIDENVDTKIEAYTSGIEKAYGNINCGRKKSVSYLHVAAVDKAGNIGATSTVKIKATDVTAPRVEKVDFNITAYDDANNPNEYVSGIAGYAINKIKTTNIQELDFKENIDWKRYESGWNYLWAIDKAGNVSEPYKFFIHSNLYFDGTEVNTLFYEGKKIKNLYYNGIQIFI